MTRRVPLPSCEQVTSTLDRLRASGPSVTVTALARELGLTNPTFWRHFPDLARQVVDSARPGPPNPTDDDAARLTRLTRDNRQLQHDLQQATANIARLTLENHRLRNDLEAATGLRHLTTANRP